VFIASCLTVTLSKNILLHLKHEIQINETYADALIEENEQKIRQSFTVGIIDCGVFSEEKVCSICYQ
jgi:hypothetical protein